MVNGLMKLGLPQNAPMENRRLALDLVGLVIHWEQRRIADSEPAPPTVSRLSSSSVLS
jgi:transformation/transcription domain-associated protein